MTFQSHMLSRSFRDDGQEVKDIILDFQGGGANIAYSIGYAIPFLRSRKVRIVQVRGTSAGAMVACLIANAINSADTYEEGCEIAADRLENFLQDLVNESEPIMNALEAMSNPTDPLGWRSLLVSSVAATPQVKATKALISAGFDIMRLAHAWNPMAQGAINAMEMPLHMGRSDHRRVKRSPNLPILEVLAQQQNSLAHMFGNLANGSPLEGPQWATAAFATDALRRLVARSLVSEAHPDDPKDRIFTHAASGKFVKAYINTAKVTKTGLVNVIHTGRDLTEKSLLGSAALKGFFQPSVIRGENHIDGGYTQNGCLTVPADEHVADCDAIVIIGTNRPRDLTVVPQHQLSLTPDELGPMKLVLHQMYRHALLRAEQWKPGIPTIHLTTYNHDPSDDWTAKQNTSAWNIYRLKRFGEDDGLKALAEHLPYFGVRSTVSKARLEAIARDMTIVSHRPHSAYGEDHYTYQAA